jgi:hypothetical protein
VIDVSKETKSMLDAKLAVEAEFTLLRKQIMGIKRRKAERFRCPIASLGKLNLPNNPENLDVWVKNLSRTGIGINLGRPLDVGTDVIVCLKGPDQKTYFRKESRVIHATAEVDGTWRVGCEFANELTEDELDSLL